MSTFCRIPDAIRMPESMKSGVRMAQRVRSIMAIAEPLLGCTGAEKGYMRRTLEIAPDKSNLLYITKNPNDTMLFPTGHPRHPEPLYEWVQDGPIRLGFLKVPREEMLGVYRETPR